MNIKDINLSDFMFQKTILHKITNNLLIVEKYIEEADLKKDSDVYQKAIDLMNYSFEYTDYLIEDTMGKKEYEILSDLKCTMYILKLNKHTLHKEDEKWKDFYELNNKFLRKSYVSN